jgi:hypothetical protein
MTGERDLAKLLGSANPSVHPDEFVYCTLPASDLPSGVKAVCLFREAEGITLILPRSVADANALPYIFPCRMITLNVHSALDAVGFLATIMSKLAAHGISTNAVSAYYHDHLFVPSERTEEALGLLKNLAG